MVRRNSFSTACQMILATDTYYREKTAVVAGVLFRHWPDAAPVNEIAVCVEDIRTYEPGRFYKRELPCILELLDQLDDWPAIIVIDGFVHLRSRHYPALGRYLFDALNAKIPVIGVAKNPVKDTPADVELCRGKSRRPLYVTAAGMDLIQAKKHIANMHGNFRIPTLLKRVDQLCRKKIRP